MKAKDIKIGDTYIARISGKLTTVRVTDIRERFSPGRYGANGRWQSFYDVVNLRTNRRTTFRSAQKFRWPAGE